MSAERWFRRFLRLLPHDFRTDYGDEMTQVFRDQRRDARGARGQARVWIATIGAIMSIGPREHAEQLRQDVAYAFRGMRRQPGFVAVAILTLALGIGANTAIFSVVHAVLLAPLPFGEPERLVGVWNRWDGRPAVTLSNPEFLDYAERSRTMTIAAAAAGESNISASGVEPERVRAAQVTVNSFAVLGVQPASGRTFSADDEGAGAGRVVILSSAYAERRFGGAAVGQSLVLNGSPHAVIGVLPPEFRHPLDFDTAAPVQLYVPFVLDRAAPRTSRGSHYLLATGRLHEGQTLASAQAEMDAIIAGLKQEYPSQHNQGNFGITLRPLREDLLGDARPVALMLTSGVGLVLLLACANVANLLLARGEARRRELALRSALGASRWRVARQLLTESCTLAVVAAAAGLLLAVWLQRAIVALDPGALPRLDQARLSMPVLGFTAALACVTGVLFGLVPAFQVRSASADDLKDGSRGGTEGRRVAARRALVVAQVAIAAILLIGGGLLARSFAQVMREPAGVRPDGVLTMRLALPAQRYPGRAEVAGFFDRALEAIRALPGVSAAGAASGLPLAVASGDWSFDIEGRGRVDGRRPGAADWYVVTPGYLETLGIASVDGRLPVGSDTETAPPVVFINETAARTIFPAGDALGKRIRFGGATSEEQPWRTIAGILRDVRTRGLDQAPRPEVFFPHRQFLHFVRGGQARAMTFAIRTSGDPLRMAQPVRAELRRLDPEIAAADVRDMSTVIARSVSDRRMHMLLVGSFGLLALVLAAVGLYGVMAFHVTQRTREMGVRVALGASRRDVLGLVVGQGMRLVLIGLVLGVAAAWALGGSLAALLYEVSPLDAVTFVAAPLLLACVGLLACYVPARRAMRVDPVVALRAE